jgi:hypothetical protein
VNPEIQWRQNSLGQVILAVAPFMTATEWGKQQEQPEVLQRASELVSRDRIAPQVKALKSSEAF